MVTLVLAAVFSLTCSNRSINRSSLTFSPNAPLLAAFIIMSSMARAFSGLTKAMRATAKENVKRKKTLADKTKPEEIDDAQNDSIMVYL